MDSWAKMTTPVGKRHQFGAQEGISESLEYGPGKQMTSSCLVCSIKFLPAS
jgi:hypothetical protein